MAFFGSGFDPASPSDSSDSGLGASVIRALKLLLQQFLTVSFDLDTGTILPGAIPNPVTIPYGDAGTQYTSAGPSLPPYWSPAVGSPIGAVVMWPASILPTGWLACDGSVQLTAAYPALASILGMTFGGDAVTNFGLPDFRGRGPVGVGTGDAADATAWALAQKRGEEGHTLTVPEIPAHGHTSLAFEGSNADNGDPGGLIETASTQDSGTQTNAQAVIGDTGGGLPHNNLQPSLGIGFIIKAL